MTKNTLNKVRWSSNSLERLNQLREARDQIDHLTDEAVEECRTAATPISWAKIAAELGVSRQSVWQRFGAR